MSTSRATAGARVLAVAGLGALVAVGCGSSRPPATTVPTTVTATRTDKPTPTKSKPLVILRPADKAIQLAHRRGNRLLATLTIRGTASPNVIVYVTADCPDPDCQQIVRTGPKHWLVRAQISVPVKKPKLDIGIGYTDPASGQPAKLLRITLKAHKVKKKTSKTSSHHHTTTTTTTEPDVPEQTDTTPTSTTTSPSGKRPVVMIGDSLAVGTERALVADLSDYSVETQARTGRTLAEGMAIFATTSLPDPRTIVAFSLFTNDEPGSVTALQGAVRFSIARLGAQGCAIWATIQRPPVGGVSYKRANEALVALAASSNGALLIVPWSRVVAHQPSLLAADGVHATPAGYARRAELYAEAARRCKR